MTSMNSYKDYFTGSLTVLLKKLLCSAETGLICSVTITLGGLVRQLIVITKLYHYSRWTGELAHCHHQI